MKKSAKTASNTPDGVELSGDLTIRGIGDAHQRLSSALKNNSKISLSITDEASVDLTLVQLIVAARRQAQEAGGDLTFATPAPQPLVEVLTRGGFLEAADGRQFWLGAGE